MKIIDYNRLIESVSKQNM